MSNTESPNRLHKQPEKRFMAHLPAEVHSAMKIRAAKEQISMKEIARRAIEAYLGEEHTNGASAHD